MNSERLKKHVKLCRKNLRDKRVKCCAECPFEAEIISAYPRMDLLFFKKRGGVVDEDNIYQSRRKA